MFQCFLIIWKIENILVFFFYELIFVFRLPLSEWHSIFPSVCFPSSKLSLLWKLILRYFGPGDLRDRQKEFISLTEPMLNKMSLLWNINLFLSTMSTILYCSNLKFFVDSRLCSPNEYKPVHFFFLVQRIFVLLMYIELWRTQDFCWKPPDFKDSFWFTNGIFLHSLPIST